MSDGNTPCEGSATAIRVRLADGSYFLGYDDGGLPRFEEVADALRDATPRRRNERSSRSR